MKRVQEIEFETDCKNLSTALRRFGKKYPEAFEVWGEHFAWMIENGQQLDDCKESCGYVVWAIQDEEHFYFCFIAFDESQIIE